MKKRLTLIIAFVVLCNMAIAQIYGVPINRNDRLEIVKAADMALDANKFGTAHHVLTLFGLPINEEASDEFAKQFSKTWDEYREYRATNAFIYWPELERSREDFLLGRLTSYGPDGSDIKELFFQLRESYHTKFLSDLTQFGYKKIKSEKKKDKDSNAVYIETTYQKENHICTIRIRGNIYNVSFTRKIRQESAEEKTISEQCERFVWLHAVSGVRQHVLEDNNVPYNVPSVVDIQFPPENKVVNISPDILNDNPEIVNKIVNVDISSSGTVSIDSYDDKVKALFNWIKPHIKVIRSAEVNFPRYGVGFTTGSSYDLFLQESKEEYDSCTVLLKVKYSENTRKVVLKNQKDVEKKLTSVYGNADMLESVMIFLPKDEIEKSIKPSNTISLVGYTRFINVHIFKSKITYTLNNKSATYMLPFVYIYGNPFKKLQNKEDYEY